MLTPPSFTINNSSINEPQNGFPGTLVFTVTLSQAESSQIKVSYATASVFGGAVAGTDYNTTSGTLTIPQDTTTGVIDVTIHGNTQYNPNKIFDMDLSNPTGGTTIATPVGVGPSLTLILNQPFSATGASVNEPASGRTANLTFQ